MKFFENPFKKKPEKKQVEYSKEAYEKAQQEVEVTNMMMKDASKPFSGVPSELRSHVLRKTYSAIENLNELHEKGQTEAGALNAEYDRLSSTSREASKAVEDSKKEKLEGSE